MRIPRQFYFKVKNMEENDNSHMDNYFSFNRATEEDQDEKKSQLNANNQAVSGGHPLVPRLALPRLDPNEEWREIVA